MVLVFPLPDFPVVILILVYIVFLNSTNVEQTCPLLRCNSLKGTYNSILPAAALSYWLANPRTFPYCRTTITRHNCLLSLAIGSPIWSHDCPVCCCIRYFTSKQLAGSLLRHFHFAIGKHPHGCNLATPFSQYFT